MAAHLSPHAFAFFSHSAFFLASTFLVFASVALLMQAVFSAAHLSLQSFRFFSTLAQETRPAIKTAAIMTIIVLFINSSGLGNFVAISYQPAILFKNFLPSTSRTHGLFYYHRTRHQGPAEPHNTCPKQHGATTSNFGTKMSGKRSSN